MTKYIESEAFIESQQHLYCKNCARRKDGKGRFIYSIGDAPCRACGIMDVLDAVADFPAADVRPVVRGKWLHKKITADFHAIGQCSVCKEIRRIDNFCPNCGADMRCREET